MKQTVRHNEYWKQEFISYKEERHITYLRSVRYQKESKTFTLTTNTLNTIVL